MYDLTIIRKNGGCYVDSREVAEAVGKDHRHLLRDIRKYCEIMEKSNAPNFGRVDFFLESSYLDTKGETRPCYLLSKMGCEMVANKLIGEKGVLFTAVYVAKFNEMEQAERAAAEKIQRPRLGDYNATARLVVRFMQKMGAAPARILTFLQNLYEPLGVPVGADDLTDAPQTYTAKQIAAELGVFSIYGNPHAHAVSCVLNEHIFIGEEHKTVTAMDCGCFISLSVRYDEYAVQAARDWLSEHSYPGSIYGAYRTYHVLYKR
jgi:Rha family phage regulatory protein